MKVYKVNDFMWSDFQKIISILDDESISMDYKLAIKSLIRAYTKNLYCSECRGSSRTSSRDGECKWTEDNMLIDLPLNDGPLESYPTYCPIRKLVK